MKPIILVALVCSTVHAETRIGVRWGEPTEPTEKRAWIRLHGVEDAAVTNLAVDVITTTPVQVTLRFQLSTKPRDAREVRLPFEVSSGVGIGAMSYAIGGEPSITASLRDADEAAAAYSAIVLRKRDPALLRFLSSRERWDMHELTVYPISRGMPAQVTVQLLLPAATHLVIDPGPTRFARVDTTLDGERRRWSDVTAPRSIALPTPDDIPARITGRYVDASSSLFANDMSDEDTRELVKRTRIWVNVARRTERSMPTVVLSDRRFELREQIRAHKEQLRHCWVYAMLQNPSRSSQITVAIAIDVEGAVTHVDVASDEDLSECVAAELRGWRFRAAAHARTVRQDIDLARIE